jgi:hypothetical protein
MPEPLFGFHPPRFFLFPLFPHLLRESLPIMPIPIGPLAICGLPLLLVLLVKLALLQFGVFATLPIQIAIGTRERIRLALLLFKDHYNQTFNVPALPLLHPRNSLLLGDEDGRPARLGSRSDGPLADDGLPHARDLGDKVGDVFCE